MSSNPAPSVQPTASFAPLENLLQVADDVLRMNLASASEEIVRDVIFPGMVAPGDRVIVEQWLVRIDKLVDAQLDSLIDEIWKEMPEMISDAIDTALGEAGRVVLPQLARNEYTCAMPCTCEPGCPGVEEDDDDCSDD